MRAGTPGVPTTTEWLNDALSPGCRIGIDPENWRLKTDIGGVEGGYLNERAGSSWLWMKKWWSEQWMRGRA
ncbi:hypothetical protein QJS10_CPB22g01317 [Acorus calamus]|uniref:Uncharacterized protein n=1 Tax=Acorus calamus TaxID=4465 RepID=A0AAV9C0U0_ACOCL|nr:hypothetical protein QJS10_CPB22g01317 [Acorus calamus]